MPQFFRDPTACQMECTHGSTPRNSAGGVCDNATTLPPDAFTVQITRKQTRARRRAGEMSFMAGVVLKNLTKSFNKVTAVNSINLEIRDKEFMVLVGPSGCGKTTALRMIAGLEEATSGEILIGERVVNDVSPKDRDIAMVFQNYALYPHMSVYDNMSFGLRLKRTPTGTVWPMNSKRTFSRDEIDRRVNEAAEMLASSRCFSASPKNCREVSVSASPWAAPSSANLKSSSWTNRSPTSTPSCACRPAPNSSSCIA